MGCDRRDRRRVEIVLDTNMLLLIASGLNIFEQIEEKLAIKPVYTVIKPVLRELEKLAKSSKPSIKKRALLALEIVKKYCRVVDVEYCERVDDAIIEYAEKHCVAVATNDRDLRKRLRERGIPEIYLREEGMRIDVEGLEI